MSKRRWVGISGSWRHSNPELVADVEREVRAVLERGDGIVTGGALGVDFQATNIALNFAPDGSRLKVILPTSLDVYAAHYRQRADEGVISKQLAERLIRQLAQVQIVGSLTSMAGEEVGQATYYARNIEVVKVSDELLAFQVNGSAGTGHAIEEFRRLKGVEPVVFAYTVET